METVKISIEKEKPDCLLAGLGGYAYGQLIFDPEEKADEKPASPDNDSHSGQKA